MMKDETLLMLSYMVYLISYIVAVFSFLLSLHATGLLQVLLQTLVGITCIVVLFFRSLHVYDLRSRRKKIAKKIPFSCYLGFGPFQKLITVSTIIIALINVTEEVKTDTRSWMIFLRLGFIVFIVGFYCKIMFSKIVEDE